MDLNKFQEIGREDKIATCAPQQPKSCQKIS